MKKIFTTLTLTAITAGVLLYLFQKTLNFKTPSSSTVTSNKEDNVVSKSVKTEESGKDIEIIAQNLEIPWDVAFLSNGEMLITERPGRLIKIGNDRKVYEISGVRHIGEGGLLGIALHPNFANNQFLYLYLTSQKNGQLINRIERSRFQNDSLSSPEIIVEGITGAPNHDGGRIEFGPDGMLYATTGDAQMSNLSQDSKSLNGKILRVKDDGSIPQDNPFGNEVYSLGHRNPQGLAWDKQGRLWSTEHGRSGTLSGFDELNLIEKGKNYGWPEIQGDETGNDMVAPIIHSGEDETWAPSGAEYINDSIFFSGLRGETLYQAKLDGEKVSSLIKHFTGQYGRLRAARLGPDGYLYITTSNRDGRGTPRENDDKIIRVNPFIFE